MMMKVLTEEEFLSEARRVELEKLWQEWKARKAAGAGSKGREFAYAAELLAARIVK